MADLISRAAAIAQIKENYCNWCDHTDLCQSCETRDCIATIEQQLPTIDAIPVEWLREKMNMADDDCDLDSVDLISWLIQTWQKEQEAR